MKNIGRYSWIRRKTPHFIEITHQFKFNQRDILRLSGGEVGVAGERSEDEMVLDRLETLGVSLSIEWDALTFVYHHATSLCTAAQMARLIGYDKAETAAALHRLEALGLIERSRVSQGLRFYRCPALLEPVRRACLMELMNLAHDRAGRMLLLKHLKRQQLEPRQRRKSGLRLA
jgi:DNA-binding MarR family transcriptional regulator